MPPSEIARFETRASYHRQMARQVRLEEGSLILTSARLIFTHSTYPFEIPLSSVLGVHFQAPNFVNLQLARRQGTGYYETKDALTIVEILKASINVHLRNSSVIRSGSRHIPQHVKAEVWRRDEERCVECGAMDYLEFDHIIPFSKGGATSVGNLQLLCRSCNLSKRDQI